MNRDDLAAALQMTRLGFRSGVDYGGGAPIKWKYLREEEKDALRADADRILAALPPTGSPRPSAWYRHSEAVRAVLRDEPDPPTGSPETLREALKRLASWDEMAGHGDPEEFPEMYRAEIRARINLARAALEGSPKP